MMYEETLESKSWRPGVEWLTGRELSVVSDAVKC